MDWRVRLAIAVIRRDLAGPLNVGALAARVHLSRSRFTYLFCRETGMAPGQYLRTCRLEQAAALLAGSPLSIKEIMAAVGVSDPSHFSRDFRRFHGTAPGPFRARARSLGRALGLPAEQPAMDEQDIRPTDSAIRHYRRPTLSTARLVT